MAVMLAALALGLVATNARGQMLEPGQAPTPNLLSENGMKPGKALLYDLEAKFAKATAEGGGKAFATWFAEDAVTLSNGQPPVHGRDAISKKATWAAKDYQLTWTPTEGVMSATGDMGYTWGHYEGRSHGPDGQTTVTTGRYLTIWRKEADESWKVILDSSSDEPAGDGDCCKLPSN
jgi:ketosteroid isomerase-like protein